MEIERNIFVLLAMVFCHICDDYYLQGILANMKQRTWWQTNAPAKLYKYDYLVALLEHSFSWGFMILLPVWVVNNFITNTVMLFALFINALLHAIIDDLKANRKVINLIVDQSIHIFQIIITWAVIV